MRAKLTAVVARRRSEVRSAYEGAGAQLQRSRVAGRKAFASCTIPASKVTAANVELRPLLEGGPQCRLRPEIVPAKVQILH